MQYLIAIDEIKQRAEEIGLSLPKLAKSAGISPSTAYRGASRVTSASRLSDALIAEELRLRDHLLNLHPVEGRGAE